MTTKDIDTMEGGTYADVEPVEPNPFDVLNVPHEFLVSKRPNYDNAIAEGGAVRATRAAEGGNPQSAVGKS